jgi:hypothetical protein
MKFRPINQKDYPKLLELDKKVYPTDNPVTSEILNKWYKKNPEFGMIFEDDNGNLEGMCITIPLNKKGWNKLINGKLAEADLDSKTLFNNLRDKEIGLHIYHIERFSDKKRFYEKSLAEINSVVNNLKKSNSELNIIGFSGLCVTASGIGLFYNKFNCRERKFINSEHVLRKDNKLEIFTTQSQIELSEKIKQNYEYINRCKMLVLYPDEPSIVWESLK